MRLADFILKNIEPILQEWEAFAQSIWPSPEVTPRELRDHAEAMLRAMAADMKTVQSAVQQSDKGKSLSNGDEPLRSASDLHALGRVTSGLSLLAVVSEYRALRASVIRLWRGSNGVNVHDLDDLTRFNEAIDESLNKAVRSYTEEVERLRQIFLGILAHDLRTPLNAMMMSAQWLARSPQLSTASTRVVSQLTASGAAMTGMIADLLDYTGSSLGKAMPISPVPMSLESLCQEVVNELQAANPACTLRYDSRGDLTGEWDPERLRQVISNLLANAAQHGTGPIDFSAVGEGAEVRLTVHNEGEPIPREHISTIFNPLMRGSSPPTRKRQPGSLGLGLHIARQIVSAHDGTIEVQSSAEAGTTFTVRLPRRSANR